MGVVVLSAGGESTAKSVWLGVEVIVGELVVESPLP